ncbi:MAG: helix-turn-helix transcriptional regulator [Propioniciclava sp.]|uniref:helix-turn-helix domain-containing protein n=1 Tax=Propioniciclava sp. TaxID=2038686 RepID=UPI0039E4B1C0
MVDTSDPRGVLFPERLPSFRRHPAPAELDGLVRWFWIPRWNLAPGQVSRQRLLPFPASNLVVESAGVTLAGPTTRASHRDLRGTGWAVGALLRPAGIAALCPDPARLRDAEAEFDAPELARTVAAAMGDADADDRAVVEVFVRWAAERLAPAGEAGLLANAMEDLIAGDRTITQVEDVARGLGVSVRGVQRIARRFVGLPPLAIIRRYRLQEAAQRLREDPSVSIAAVAADLGYADHAHLTSDFRRVLGFTPSSYRDGVARAE